jgi:hypothetical protein
MIEAQLADGTILEFPDGTDRSVIQRVVKQRMGMGSGEVGAIEDLAKSVGSGVVKGLIGTAELPEMAGRAIYRGGQEALQYFGYDAGEDKSILNTSTGSYLRENTSLDDYDPKTKLGKVAGMASEFVGGGGGLGAAGKVAKLSAKGVGRVLGDSKTLEAVQKIGDSVGSAGLSKEALSSAAIAGAGSELAGQSFEGSPLEGPARFLGAIASPAAAAKFVNMPARTYDAYIKPRQIANKINTGNKTVDAVVAKSIKKPTSENLSLAKNTAYKVADDAGVNFSVNQLKGVAENARNSLFSAGSGLTKYNPTYDSHISEALARLDDVSENTSLLGLDSLRSEIYEIYRIGLGQGKKSYDPKLRTVIDELDSLVDSSLEGSRLLSTAKLANKRYKKSELLRDAMDNAEVSAGASQSGDVISGYRRAIARIVNNPKQSKFFDEGELGAMRAILDGTISSDVLKKMGTLSPNTNGLMRTVSGVAAFIEPSSLIVSATGLISKFASDSGVKMQLDDLDRLLATGQTPTRFTPTRVAPALGASQQVQQELQ